MRIFTSSWFTPLPDTIQKIGVSRGTPRRYPPGYRRIPELAPGSWFSTVSPEEYDRRFSAMLAALDPKTVLAKIESLAAGKDVALLCYEAPGDPKAWCHRGQLSRWFKDTLHLDVYEYGMEAAGCGNSHPKIYAPLRAAN